MKGSITGTFRRIGNTCMPPYAPWSTAHDGELPVSPHQLPISPWGVMGSCCPQADWSGSPVHEDAGEVLHGRTHLSHPLTGVGQGRRSGLTLDADPGQALPGPV